MNRAGAIAVVACDLGAKAAVAPLLRLPDYQECAEIDPGREFRAVMTGTSNSANGVEIEAAARRFARAAGIASIALEDYPGNYMHVEASEPDVLVVESEQVARLHGARTYGRAMEFLVCPAPRYDALRGRSSVLRQAYARRAGSISGVLWAGQPETRNALITLGRILPALRALRVTLLFRAHPGDPGYREGRYRPLLEDSGLAVMDVTSDTLERCFEQHPALVVTQFSSVAVEAGFWGIPSLHVLYPDAGGGLLESRKGYRVPPFIEDDAAFLIADMDGPLPRLESALRNESLRRQTLERFDAYFGATEPALPKLLTRLYNSGHLYSPA